MENGQEAYCQTGTSCPLPCAYSTFAARSTHISRCKDCHVVKTLDPDLPQSGWKLKDFKLDNTTLTEMMVCGTTSILQETKFHVGDSFETTMTNTNGGVVKVSQIKGRRTGDCKAGAE